MTEWILEWLPKNERQAKWLPFGLPHSLNEIEEKIKDVEQRMPDSHWRIVPLVDNSLIKC
ncbi:MAG: hypothetical protein MN733_01300 [Nitrososphaera sp.]|nr:hypothetical protein [Nitrososphaera sp.]